ncbi:g5569 [Coccomyxa viridis]|uniref:G5569 protein n=1 Tax=Coccomyxa viridis TaxID=1274662 RepID=A0ABP1FZU1_9CHLO
MPNVQQEESAPKQEAPAAHAQTPATQEEGPWQEVKSSRRRPSSQHTASELGAHKAAKQSRDAPDQDDPPPPPPQPLRLQVAEQKQGQAQLPTHGTMHTDPRFTISSYEQAAKGGRPEEGDAADDDDDLCVVCWESAPARAVPETSWRQGASVPCAAPRSRAPPKSGSE